MGAGILRSRRRVRIVAAEGCQMNGAAAERSDQVHQTPLRAQLGIKETGARSWEDAARPLRAILTG
ncbi:MAG: hypothetical protein ACI841_002396 [Planctomycetota bacterium]|jgi:hypothetical protein